MTIIHLFTSVWIHKNLKISLPSKFYIIVGALEAYRMKQIARLHSLQEVTAFRQKCFWARDPVGSIFPLALPFTFSQRQQYQAHSMAWTQQAVAALWRPKSSLSSEAKWITIYMREESKFWVIWVHTGFKFRAGDRLFWLKHFMVFSISEVKFRDSASS
jgi:hypothetical protein